MAGLSERQRARFRKGNIGFVFQSFYLIDEPNVYENVELPLLYLGMSASEREARVLAALERVHIVHRKNHFPSNARAASSSVWPSPGQWWPARS